MLVCVHACVCDREPAGSDTETDCVKAVLCISATALRGTNRMICWRTSTTINLSSSGTGHLSFVRNAPGPLIMPVLTPLGSEMSQITSGHIAV